jgi:hypothetical protein
MKSIPLTKGKFALVDDGDYEYLNQFKWQLHDVSYAKRGKQRGGKYITILMHREIIKPPAGMGVDHINGNPLDNRRENLRVCEQSQNTANRGLNKKNSSGMIGVHKSHGKWRACIKVNYQNINLGHFDNLEDAVKARDEAAKKYRGEFARLNA